MSTKIHHGYRLAEGTDIFAFAHRLRAALNPVRDRVDAAWLIDYAVSAADRADRHGQARTSTPLIDAMSAYDETQDKENASGYRQASLSRGWDPHRFEASFALDAPQATGAETGTGRILVRVFTEQPALLQVWESMPEVEAWPYWNNADRPEDVTEAEWEERGDAYRRTLADGAPATESSLNFALRSPIQDIGMVMMVHPHRDASREAARLARFRETAPSLDDRVAARVRDMCFAAAVTTRTGITDRAEAISALDNRTVFALVRRYSRPSEALRALPAYAALVAAAEATLDADVVDWVLTATSNDPAPTWNVDMAPAEAAARALIDAEPPENEDT